MIEEISGPGSQSLLRIRFDLIGFSDEEVKEFADSRDLLPFQPSSLLADAWTSQWGNWITLDHVLEQDLSPGVLIYILKTFAEVYERHRSENYSLLWERSCILYRLDENDGEYDLKLNEPQFVRSKVDLAEDFFQELLEMYLKSDDLSSELATKYLVARDEDWPSLLETLLDRRIHLPDPTYIDQHVGVKIKRVEHSPSDERKLSSYFPPPIPLACLTQVPPHSGRLSARHIFWIEGKCILGSSPERADFLLKSSQVLPEHCSINYEGTSYSIRTLGTGSIRVNGKTMGRNEVLILPTSCDIEIADIKLYFFMEAESNRLIA